MSNLFNYTRVQDLFRQPAVHAACFRVLVVQTPLSETKNLMSLLQDRDNTSEFSPYLLVLITLYNGLKSFNWIQSKCQGQRH